MIDIIWLVIRLVVITIWFSTPVIFLSMIFITPKLDKYMSLQPNHESQWLVHRFTRFHKYGIELIRSPSSYPECPAPLKVWVVFSTLVSIVFTISCMAILFI